MSTAPCFDFSAEEAALYALEQATRVGICSPKLLKDHLSKPVSNALTSFNLFPNLPFDVRNKILRMAIIENGGGQYFWLGMITSLSNDQTPSNSVKLYGSTHQKHLRMLGAVCKEFRAEIFRFMTPLVMTGPQGTKLWNGIEFGELGGPWDVKSKYMPYDRLIDIERNTLVLDYNEIKAAWNMEVSLVLSRVKYLAIWFQLSQCTEDSPEDVTQCILNYTELVFPELRELSVCVGPRPSQSLKRGQSNGLVEIDDNFADMDLTSFQSGFLGTNTSTFQQICTKAKAVKSIFDKAQKVARGEKEDTSKSKTENSSGTKGNHSPDVKEASATETKKDESSESERPNPFWANVVLKVKMHAFMAMVFNGRCHMGDQLFLPYPSKEYDNNSKSYVLVFPYIEGTTPCDQYGRILPQIESNSDDVGHHEGDGEEPLDSAETSEQDDQQVQQ